MKNVCKFLLLLTVCATATFAQVRVEKLTTNKNPTLFVNTATFSQDATKVAAALKFSDWFNVVNTANADFTLKITSATTMQLKMILFPRGQNGIAINKSSPANLLHLKAADEVINTVFNKGNKSKPIGICASQIAFVGQQSALIKEIYVGLAPYTSLSRQITHNKRLSVEPEWAPNGAQLLYTLYEKNGTNVILVNLIKQTQKAVSAFNGLNAGAAFAPNGKEISVILSKDGKPEIYTVNVESGKSTRITTNNFEEGCPVWSPNGAEILAIANNQRTPGLYIFNRNGGVGNLLYQTSSECQSPDWSPISNKIVFSIRMGKEYQIAVIDMTTRSAPKIITKTNGSWESPSWAPDGRHIVCSRTIGNTSALYMIDTWYDTQKKLNTPAGISGATLPAWSPLYK